MAVTRSQSKEVREKAHAEAIEKAYENAREVAIEKSHEEAIEKAREEDDEANEITRRGVIDKNRKKTIEKAEKDVQAQALKRKGIQDQKKKDAQNKDKDQGGKSDEEKKLEAQKKKIEKEANKQAHDIGLSFYKIAMSTAQEMDYTSSEDQKKKARRLEEIQAGEIALQQQGIVYISLESAAVSMKISAFKTQFDFAPAKNGNSKTISATDIKDFCSLIKDFQKACAEQKAEGLECTLIGSDLEGLRKIAKGIVSEGIQLDKIQYNGVPPKVFTSREDIVKFINEKNSPDINLNIEAKANRM